MKVICFVWKEIIITVKDFTKGNPIKVAILFAVSLAVTNAISYLYSTVDSIMVGRMISTDALAAIAVISPVLVIVNGLCSGIAIGCGIVTGQIFGSKDIKLLKKTMANIVFLLFIFMVAMTFICSFLCEDIVRIMNAPEDVFEMSYKYMKILFMTLLLSTVPLMGSSIFRSLGDNRTPLIISMISGALNVVFNYLFIGILKTGIEGAAYGTVCSRIFSNIAYLIVYFKKMDIIHFSLRESKLSFTIIRKLFITGIPIGIQTSITFCGSSVLQSALNTYGKTVVTGVTVADKLISIIWIIIESLGTTMIYFCAQNKGANRIDRIKKGVPGIIATAIVISAVMSLMAVFYGKYFITLFVEKSPEIIEISEKFIIIQLSFFIFVATLPILRGSVQGMGYTKVAVICGFIELIPRILISLFFSYKLEYLYFAAPIAWVLASLFLLAIYPVVIRKTISESILFNEKISIEEKSRC